jgi:hypothetical protein
MSDGWLGPFVFAGKISAAEFPMVLLRTLGKLTSHQILIPHS